jgi:rhodanese-related sulfurtransferase
MRYLQLSLLAVGALLLYTCRSGNQIVPQRLKTSYPPLDRKLARMVAVDSSTVSPVEAQRIAEAVFLDARSEVEYAVSHIPGALYVGFSNPDFTVIEGVGLDIPLIVYCTVGYRSERIAKDLRRRGFMRVHNLYGSLYAWKLAGYILVDALGRPTDKLHTYNRQWSRYAPDTIGTKVY